MTHQEHIENVIRRTYNIVQAVFEKQQEICPVKDNMPNSGSRIIFPKYRKNVTRFSEQKLRFVFVEQLNREIASGWDVYYSVETPTRYKYKFKNETHPVVIRDNSKEGQSAQFDLVIHNNIFERIILIEFKANNASVQHHEKDFLKLESEGDNDILTYFLEIVKSSDKGTSESLLEKCNTYKGHFLCWSCSQKDFIIKK